MLSLSLICGDCLLFKVVQCQLAGLEDYGDEKIAHNIMIEMLLGKVFVAEVQTRDLNTRIASVVLYDTSTEEDINVNETLINRICIEGTKPQLPIVSKKCILCFILL